MSFESGILLRFSRSPLRVTYKHIPSNLELSTPLFVISKDHRKVGRKSKRKPLPPTALGSRIRKAREARGLSLTALGNEIKVSNQALSLIETGGSNPSLPTLRLLAQALHDDFQLAELEKDAHQSVRQIPIVAYVAGGKPIVEEIDNQFVNIDPATMKLSGDVTALRVKGDSMIDQHILNGDILICRKGSEPRKGQISVIDLKGERGATVKRWQRKGEMIYLYADKNARDHEKQAFHDWEIGKALEILGLIREFR